jgi:hypothetical protein
MTVSQNKGTQQCTMAIRQHIGHHRHHHVPSKPIIPSYTLSYALMPLVLLLLLPPPLQPLLLPYSAIVIAFHFIMMTTTMPTTEGDDDDVAKSGRIVDLNIASFTLLEKLALPVKFWTSSCFVASGVFVAPLHSSRFSVQP